MAVSKRLRYEVLKRDNHTCRYCGGTAPDVVLTVDHVVPVTLGGLDVPENLVTACRDCNAGKSSMPADAGLIADVAEDAMRWRKAMEIANEMAARDHEVREAVCDEFLSKWNSWTYKVPSYRSGSGKEEIKTIDLPGGWKARIGELVAAGLTVIDMRDAVDAAMGAPNVKDEFSYFVGVARNKLSNRQAVAQELIRRGLA